MAIQNIVVDLAGVSASKLNSQAALATVVSDAITAADTANASNDATTEIAAIGTALTALTANQPSGAVVIAVNLSTVTTKNQLRKALDDAYRYLADSTNILS